MEQKLQQEIEDFRKKAKEMKEFELFLFMEGLGCVLWREKKEFFDGKLEISEKQLQDNQEYGSALQKECLAMLGKFDVDTKSIIDPNGNYQKWFNHWKTWMKGFSDEKWKEFEKKLENKENVDEFLPQKKWNE